MLKGVDVARPITIEEVSRLLAGGSAMALAGGTDVLVELRKHPAPGTLLVDLTRVVGLRGIREEGGQVVIGAMTTHQEAADSELLRRRCTALAMGCSQVGSLQVRNRGTLAGNVANASPCADGLTALVGLGAVAELFSVEGGTREVLVEDLVEAPYRTGLGQGELIKCFKVPVRDQARSYFVKLGRRKALAISRINAACTLTMGSGKVKECILAVGSVMPRTSRVREAEQVVAGRPPGPEAAREAAAVVADKMVEVSGVRWSTPYKQPAVAAVVERVVLGAMGLDWT